MQEAVARGGWGRAVVPALVGIAGVWILLSLAFWQLDRLGQKLELIAGIEARIAEASVELDALLAAPLPSPDAARYRPARAAGRYTGEAVHVLSSIANHGVGSRVIAVLETTGGHRVLVDRGFLPEDLRAPADQIAESVTVSGTLDWPRDSDAFTPAPDSRRGLWFSREVAPIAAHLGAEPVMIVAREELGAPLPGLAPMPVGIDIRNDHLEYAITWFLLATTWAAMSLYLIWRIRRDPA